MHGAMRQRARSRARDDGHNGMANERGDVIDECMARGLAVNRGRRAFFMVGSSRILARRWVAVTRGFIFGTFGVGMS